MLPASTLNATNKAVINPTKAFDNFLFMYKPESDVAELKDYLENGGISRQEILNYLKETACQRMKEQGFGDNLNKDKLF